MPKRQTSSGSHGAALSATYSVKVIIETPKGSRNKFKYDPDARMFTLSKVLPEGMMFPYDFGFVPFTKGGDGDPVDVLVLMDEPTFPGCLLECKLVGVLEAEQEEKNKRKQNPRLIAVAKQSLLYSNVTRLSDIDPTILKQIEAFFINYQKVRDVRFTILARRGPDRALKILRAAAAG
jgi:inorganic pyrophosphatase